MTGLIAVFMALFCLPLAFLAAAVYAETAPRAADWLTARFGGTRRPREERPIASETWFWEQIVHALLVLGAAIGSIAIARSKGPIAARDVFLLIVGSVGQIVAQKQRSFSTRQAALEKRLKHERPLLRCERNKLRQPTWAAIGQVLGAFTSIAAAPSLLHLPLLLWATFYGAWRAHRERRKDVRR